MFVRDLVTATILTFFYCLDMHFQLYMGSQLGVSLHDVSIFITYPAGMDYTTLITTLTFSVAMPTQVVTIPILDDLIVESSKSFSVTLTTTDPAVTLNIQTATVTIRGMIMGTIYYCTNAAHVVGNTNSISQLLFQGLQLDSTAQ